MTQTNDPGVSQVPPIWGREIPFRNQHFTGRERELDRLRASLGATSQAVLGHPPQPLYGLGGVGKTEIAAEYCHRYADDYDLVWWIRAEQEDTVRNALIALGRRMGLPEFSNNDRDYSSQVVIDALRTGKRYARWLLVFDNVNEPDMVRRYIPQGTGHVIITSRIALWRKELNSEGVEVGTFSSSESVAFLRKRIPDLGAGDTVEAEAERAAQAERLGKALGHLPLASEHAAAYVIETKIPVTDYVELYQDNAYELLGQPVDIWYPDPVATTWELSRGRISPPARALFELLCFFSPEPISVELVVRPSVARGEGLPATLSGVISDERRFRDGARELARFSLLKFFGVRNVVQIHRVLQDVTRGRMRREAPELVDEYQTIAHRLLAASDPGNPDKETTDPQYELSKQHLIPSDAHKSADTQLRALIINQVRRMHLRGGYHEGLSLGEFVLKSWREQFGSDDLQTLMLALEVAICLFQLGETERAGNLTVDIRSRLAEAFGRDNDVYLKAAGIYSRCQRHQGRYAEAYAQDIELLPLYERVFSDDVLPTTNLLNNIAVDLRCLGRYEEAMAYDQRAYDARSGMFGDNADYTLSSRFAIARNLRKLGRIDESLTLIRKVGEMSELKHQPWHAGRLQFETDLAVALRWAGFYQEAADLAELNYQRHLEVLGPAHRQTLNCAVNLINSRRLVSDYRRAIEIGEQTMNSWEKVAGGMAHPNPQAAAVNLAIAHRLYGNPLRASKLDRDALDFYRDSSGEEHPNVTTVMTNLASDLAALGNVREARELGEVAVEILCRTLGAHHVRTLAAAGNLVLDRRASGDEEGAEALYAQTVTFYAESLPNHPHAVLIEQGGRVDVDIEPMSQ